MDWTLVDKKVVIVELQKVSICSTRIFLAAKGMNKESLESFDSRLYITFIYKSY